MWSYKWETAGTFYTSCIAPVQAVIIYRRAWTTLSTVTKSGVYLHSAVRGLTCFCSHSKLKICLREAAGAVQRLQVCKLKPGSTNSVKKEIYTSISSSLLPLRVATMDRQLTPSLTSCSVAPTLYMSSCTASVNILWGLPLFPPPGSAVFTILCLVFLNIVSLTLSANLLFLNFP